MDPKTGGSASVPRRGRLPSPGFLSQFRPLSSTEKPSSMCVSGLWGARSTVAASWPSASPGSRGRSAPFS
eukprot:1737393-Lingulodinium_polyedra.AAC.1